MAFVTLRSPDTIAAWYYDGKFKTPKHAKLFNPGTGNNMSSLEVFGWPYTVYKPFLEWPELVADEKSADKAINGKGNSIGKKKYYAITKFENSNLVIGYRREPVDYIRQYELHPYIIEVISGDLSRVEIITMITTEVTDGMQFLGFEDPLRAVGTKVAEALINWANTLPLIDVIKVNTDMMKSGDKQININGMFYLDYINKGFSDKSRGIQIVEVDIAAIAISASAKKIIDAYQDNAAAKSEADRRLMLNTAKAAENTTELTLFQGKLDAQTKFVNATKEAEVAKIQAYGGKVTHLVFGANQTATDVIVGNTASK